LSFRIRVSGEESAFLCGRSRSVARSRLAFPHRTDAFRRGKPPPKRSLDGAPSRLEMNAMPGPPACCETRGTRLSRGQPVSATITK